MTSMIPSLISSNVHRSIPMPNETDNEEDQLNRINLQALQNRDPYIARIIDQAQRVCVYKFLAEKREWERKELEGTLFVYERTCEPFHGFVILSTVSRETFVQIIKPSMEFKHSPNYEAFLQYKVDVGDIYGIWFISKNDCPRVTECLKRLTSNVKEHEQLRQIQPQTPLNNGNGPSMVAEDSSDIFSLLLNAQEKFQGTKRKPDSNTADPSVPMPAALMRLFSTQDTPLANNDEREQELKKTLGILGKPPLSVSELEKQLLHPPLPVDTTGLTVSNATKGRIPIPAQSISPTTMKNAINQWSATNINPSQQGHSVPINNARLMTPAEFQALYMSQSAALATHAQDRFSKEMLRHLLVDMLQNDDEFLTGLHAAYTEQQYRFY